MAILAIIGFLVGTALGLRFRVLALIPVIGFAWVVVAAITIAHGDGVWRAGGAMAVVAVSIQLGYLGATALRAMRREAGRRPIAKVQSRRHEPMGRAPPLQPIETPLEDRTGHSVHRNESAS
jgi:hypothetical protein